MLLYRNVQALAKAITKLHLDLSAIIWAQEYVMANDQYDWVQIGEQ